jgi:hypothetical protein
LRFAQGHFPFTQFCFGVLSLVDFTLPHSDAEETKGERVRPNKVDSF